MTHHDEGPETMDETPPVPGRVAELQDDALALARIMRIPEGDAAEALLAFRRSLDDGVRRAVNTTAGAARDIIICRAEAQQIAGDIIAERDAADASRSRQQRALEQIGVALCEELGMDLDDPAVADTPARWARMWMELLHRDPGVMDTSFPHVHVDQIVAVGPMRVWSLCEHHLLPFWCDITIGYIPGDTVLGLSKFARIAHHHASRPQLQERLVADIAAHVQELTHAPHVAVLATGEHLCMTMRGIRTAAPMTTSLLFGAFRDDAATRAEWFHMIGSARR